jgi:hypothetical protein
MTEVLCGKDPFLTFHMEQDTLGQWIVKYSDGSWSVASAAEVAMWKMLYNQGHV